MRHEMPLIVWTIALLLLIYVLAAPQTFAQRRDFVPVRAPELRAESWLNTDDPLSIRDLRGQIVLLDFWTYCCINCIHVFPDLKYIEDKYRDEPVVVVGVHSGKFRHEKDARHIRQAILRHNLEHPVAVDSDSTIWDEYAVSVWPTFVLIDPRGYIVGKISGEGHRDKLDRAIADLLREHRSKGTLSDPLSFTLEREGFTPGVLQFPGKVLADAEGERLFISDTNHHRVLIADLEGNVTDIVGDGEIGLRDGPFNEAEFHQPQGLALSDNGQTLYVADLENHALRAVDLVKKRVSTLAGTGEQSYDAKTSGYGPKTPLSSPWDLARVDDKLYIAMAGLHQIWVYDIDRQRVHVFAGTAREGGRDGVNRAAWFAQPSGLATDGRVLYVADSEISSIRTVELRSRGRTSTIAGSSGLFDFGDRNGVGADARFQHPLGVALHGDTLYVADTFNHRIRAIDIESRTVSNWLGTGTPERGTTDAIGLYEPGGLSIVGDTLYIADTNNHRVLAVDIPTRTVRELKIALPK